jgi:hypothetical protein
MTQEDVDLMAISSSLSQLKEAYAHYDRETMNSESNYDDLIESYVGLIDMIPWNMEPILDITEAVKLVIDNGCNLSNCVHNLLVAIWLTSKCQEEFTCYTFDKKNTIDILFQSGAKFDIDRWNSYCNGIVEHRAESIQTRQNSWWSSRPILPDFLFESNCIS